MHIVASPAFHPAVSNPYTTLLYEAMIAGDHTVVDFSPGTLARGRADIWHLHWPDQYLSHASRPKSLARVVALAGLIRLASRRGTKIVWTAHNVSSHEQYHPRLERLLWNEVTRVIDGVICLTESGVDRVADRHPAMADVPTAVIPHGHYRQAYQAPQTMAPSRNELGLPANGRLVLHLGAIRPYKNTEALIREFRAANLDDTTLVIAGKPSNESLRHSIETAARGASNVILRLDFVPERHISTYVAACDVMALPFSDINNSGSAILGLSFDRPVIVPGRAALVELEERYGSGWVRTYEPPLSADKLRALISDEQPSDQLDLSDLSWSLIAADTGSFFQSLIDGERSADRGRASAAARHP